jgi:hypothetical protein
MATVAITGLPAGASASGSDVFPYVQSGTTKKITYTNLFTNAALVTPNIGVATATSVNKVALTAPATGCTLTIAEGKTLTVDNTITFSGTDSTTISLPSTSATMARTDAAQTFTGAQTFSTGVICGVQALSGAGAVNLTTPTTAFTSTGASQALTLANGTVGQIKTIVHVVDGGSGVLTPTTALNYTTITFTNAADAVTLQYFTQGWAVIGVRGATVA